MDKKSLFDEKGRVEKGFTKEVVGYLCSLASPKERGSKKIAADMLGIQHGHISLLENGTLRIYKDKQLAEFARQRGVGVDELVSDVEAHLKSLVAKKETPPKPALPAPVQSDPAQQDSEGSEEKNEMGSVAVEQVGSFLVSLKMAMGNLDETAFEAELNKQPLWPETTNMLGFMQTGSFPWRWLDLIGDERKKQKIISNFGCHFGDEGTVVSSDVESAKQKEEEGKTEVFSKSAGDVVRKCSNFRDLPPKVMEAFFDAGIAGGKAAHDKVALAVFLGCLVLNLPGYAVSSSESLEADHSAVVKLIGEKETIEYVFDTRKFDL